MRVPRSALLIAAFVFHAAGSADAGQLKSWDTVIPDGDKRFKVLKAFNDEAVLDKETELVWEKSPDTATAKTWFDAQIHCYSRVVGGKMGWRPPTIEEATSLLDPTVLGVGAKLPPGHPFEAGTTNYWSSTTAAHDTTTAWFVRLANGSANTGDKTEDTFARAWCVRGGHGHDGGH